METDVICVTYRLSYFYDNDLISLRRLSKNLYRKKLESHSFLAIDNLLQRPSILVFLKYRKPSSHSASGLNFEDSGCQILFLALIGLLAGQSLGRAKHFREARTCAKKAVGLLVKGQKTHKVAFFLPPRQKVQQIQALFFLG